MFIVKKIGNTLQELTWNAVLVHLVESVSSELERAGKSSHIPDAVLELYRRLDESTLSQALLSGVIQRTGLDESKILGRVTELKAFLIEAQAGLEPLLLQIGEPVDKPVKIELTIIDATKEQPVGDFSLVLGANSAACFQVENFSDTELPATWGDSHLKHGRALLQTKLHGSITVRGALNGVFGSVGVGVNAGQVHGVSVKLFHEFSASRSRAEALLAASQNHSPPWDLRGLQEKLVKPNTQGAVDGFRRVQIHGKGEISLALQASIGKSYSYTGSLDDRLSEDTNIIEASLDVGAKLKTSIDYDSTVLFLVEKDSNGDLLISLKSDRTNVRAHDFTLGAVAEIEGLDAVARQYTDRIFAKSDPLIDKLRKWTKPGEALLDKMEAKDWQTDSVVRLGHFLLGSEERAPSAQKAAREFLNKRMAKALDKAGLDWLSDPASYVDSAVEQAIDGLALTEELSTLLIEDVSARVMSHWESVEEDLRARLEEAFDDGDASKLLSSLNEAGIEFDERLSSIRKLANSDVKPFREFLNDYDEVRQRIESALEKSAHTRLELQFFSSATRSRNEGVLLSFRLKKITPETIAIYRSMLLGEVDLWGEEFSKATQKGWISDVDGVFNSVLDIERSIGFKLNIGESLSLERSRVRSERIEISVDNKGELVAGSASIRNIATSVGWRNRRETSLIGFHDFLSSAIDPDADSTFNVTVSYASEDANPKRLGQFLGSLEKAASELPLLPQGATYRALGEFEERIAAFGLDGVSASITLNLPIELQDLTALLDLSDNQMFSRAVDVQLNTLLTAGEHKTLDLVMKRRRRGAENLMQLVRDMGKYRVGNSYNAGRLLQDLGFTPTDNLQARLRDQFLEKLYIIGVNAMGLRKAVIALRNLSDIHSTMSYPAAGMSKDKIRRFENDIARELRRFNREVSPWLQTRGIIGGLFTESVHPRTLALLLLLRDLIEPGAYLFPVLNIDNLENGRIIVL